MCRQIVLLEVGVAQKSYLRIHFSKYSIIIILPVSVTNPIQLNFFEIQSNFGFAELSGNGTYISKHFVTFPPKISQILL